MTKPAETTVIRAVRPTGRNDLYHTTDGYDWVFENSDASKIDVCKPGFFNVYREEMRPGATRVLETMKVIVFEPNDIAHSKVQFFSALQ